MNAPRYDFTVRDDVDCLVAAVCNENPALKAIGERDGFDAVMQTLLVAGCMYMRGVHGIDPDPNAPAIEVAKAARVLGFSLVTRPNGDIVVAAPGTGQRMAVVERDAAYDQTERGAAVADCASDALARGAA